MEKILLETPKVMSKTFTYTHFVIKDVIITLNKNAKFIIILYGEDTDVIDIPMTDEEYIMWGNDDNYVVEFIKGKIQSYNV